MSATASRTARRGPSTSTSRPRRALGLERFIGSGRLPDPARPAPGPDHLGSTTSTHTDQITVKVGPLSGTADGTTDQGQVIETVHADGTKVTTIFAPGNTVLAHEFTKDPSGAIVADKYALHLQDVDEDYVDGYQQLSGHHGETDSNADLTLNYSSAHSTPCRTPPRSILAAQRGWTAARSRTAARATSCAPTSPSIPSRRPRALRRGQDRIILTDMAAAKDAFGVLVALQNSGLGNANSVAEFLMNFHFDTLRRAISWQRRQAHAAVGGCQNRPKGC